ncbi:helicase associated domain-containing protein [Streptomyces sp. NPDC058655]|uniref:helicase associated domain-containing protein n=1 Tax=Streptomyces sp. NPDC058655 TaxID=3346577 RepID=UPI003665CB46
MRDPETIAAFLRTRVYRLESLAQLAETVAGGVLPAIQPGIHFDADELGRWLTRQARGWAQLSPEQQERLAALGVMPAQAPSPAPAAAGAAKSGTGRA